mmetsp:Transcript_13790/g.27914  ORF Transcript_13790/g.27914 Transcript_13790/m.27914 type:complete len:612 (-) Transcript_13790:1074-2909(-)
MSTSPYAPAAKILNEIWMKRKGLKTIVYSKDGELKCSTSTYAICCHVLKQKQLLKKLLESMPKIEAKNEGLVYILLYELLMGPNKKIRGGGALKRQIMSQIDMLQEKFKQLAEEEGWKDDDHNGKTDDKSKKPRYVRINTLVASQEEVLKTIRAKTDGVYIDPHVPDLLVLDHTPQSRALLQDLVVSQKVVLQDKSSCFSALCMVHGFGNYYDDASSSKKRREIDYLDACAAPGNKTSHLAALVSSTQQDNDSNGVSTIHALDKSTDRYKLLKRRMGDLVPQGIVHCHNEDFFEISKRNFGEIDGEDDNKIIVDKKFQNIQAIMLDPSCSGSGMTSNHTENSVSRDPLFTNDRITTLSNFQFQALHHATTDFPRVDRVVYSTCSLYVQENEGVVQRLLESNSDWELCSPTCLESWHRRGLVIKDDDESYKDETFASLTQEQAKCLIRVDPDEDPTSGFFVACFQRKKESGKKNTKQGKKNVSLKVTNDRASITIPKGMELYNNQFYSPEKSGAPVREKPREKPKSDAKKSNESSSDAAENSSTNSNPNAKRKAKQISPAVVDAAADDGSTKPVISNKISKKRAKKLEWKKRQRLKKEARMKSQAEKAAQTA